MAHRVDAGHTNVGQTKTVTVTCRNSAGVLTDPTTLTARVVSPEPGAEIVTYVNGTDSQWSRTSEGIYTLTITPDYGHPEPWYIHVQSVTGTVTATTILSLTVDSDPF